MVEMDPIGTFISAYNLCYASTDLPGRGAARLTREELLCTTLDDDWAQTGLQPDGTIYFGYNPSWFDSHSREECLGLIIHELGHVNHQSHDPTYWERVAGHYKNLKRDADKLSGVAPECIDWEAVKEWLVAKDPRNVTVKNSVETAYERRRTMARRLGYPVEELSPFGNMYTELAESAEHYPEIDHVTYESATVDEIIKYIHSDQGHLEYDTSGVAWVVNPIPVERTDNGFTVTDGHEVVSYLAHKYAGHPRKQHFPAHSVE